VPGLYLSVKVVDAYLLAASPSSILPCCEFLRSLARSRGCRPQRILPAAPAPARRPRRESREPRSCVSSCRQGKGRLDLKIQAAQYPERKAPQIKSFLGGGRVTFSSAAPKTLDRATGGKCSLLNKSQNLQGIPGNALSNELWHSGGGRRSRRADRGSKPAGPGCPSVTSTAAVRLR
jgi:hypothetical protein